MEPITINNSFSPSPASIETAAAISSSKVFIEANTIPCSLDEIRNDHIIPVFIKDNEPLISHADFIDVTIESVMESYKEETVIEPNIRLSHPIKGRVPDAKLKPANELLEHEKTLYYERMAFIVEIPSVYEEIEGNILHLMVGGVKSYSQDHLYSKKGSDEHFKIFIGFKNTVCTNLCVWSDGLIRDLKVTTKGQLKASINSLIDNYNANFQLHTMRQLSGFHLSEEQFALLIGRMKMYPFLPRSVQSTIPPLVLGESQINTIVRDYFKDDSFAAEGGTISLWRFYNLLTGANKSSYIDTFIERSANAFEFTERIKNALAGKSECWYLNHSQ